jgi:hypothetical protein
MTVEQRGVPVTEAEWTSSTDAEAMLSFLLHSRKVSDRKLRLFAVAAYRRVWQSAGAGHVPREVTVSERFADGEAECAALRAVRSQLGARGGYSAAWAENNTLHAVLEDSAATAARHAAGHGPGFFYFLALERDDDGPRARERATAARQSEEQALAVVLRDIVPNPFRPVAVEPSWRTPTVLALAKAIYDGRAFERMGELGHALEEVGCADPAVLDHCRSRDHVRGCWVIDGLLGRD